LTALTPKKSSSTLLENQAVSDSLGKETVNIHEYLKEHQSHEEHVLVSVVIPVYNEENTIKSVLEKLPNDVAVEIIVINDCSTDNSIKQIKNAKNFQNIKLVNHSTNQGYGSALLSGIKIAKGDILVTMDSDGQHRSDDLFNLIQPILDGEADITIGSRYKGSYNYKLPLTTRLGEAMLETAILFLFGQRVKNNQNGFRAFHRRTFNIFDNIRFKGYAFTTELILKAALYDYKMKECPIHLLEREHGTSYIVLTKLISSLLLCIGIYFFKKINRILLKK